jgi:hypothetical protein
MRAIVVARTGPLIDPYAFATRTSVEIEKPGHAGLLGSQAIVTTRYEFDESAIAQILKLLTYLWFDVLIAGIEIAEMALECVHLVKGKVAFPQRLHTFHNVEQPPARIGRFAPEEERSLPFGKDQFFRPNDSAPHNMNLPGLWDSVEQDFRTDPSRAPRSRRKWLALLDDLANEEMFWHDEQVHNRKRFEIVVHEQKVGIVACGKALAFGVEFSVQDLRAEFVFLALKLELLTTGRTEKIGEWAVVGES